MAFLSKSTAHRSRIVGRQIRNLDADEINAVTETDSRTRKKQSGNGRRHVLIALIFFLGILALLAAPLLFWAHWV